MNMNLWSLWLLYSKLHLSLSLSLSLFAFYFPFTVLAQVRRFPHVAAFPAYAGVGHLQPWTVNTYSPPLPNEQPPVHKATTSSLCLAGTLQGLHLPNPALPHHPTLFNAVKHTVPSLTTKIQGPRRVPTLLSKDEWESIRGLQGEEAIKRIKDLDGITQSVEPGQADSERSPVYQMIDYIHSVNRWLGDCCGKICPGHDIKLCAAVLSLLIPLPRRQEGHPAANVFATTWYSA